MMTVAGAYTLLFQSGGIALVGTLTEAALKGAGQNQLANTVKLITIAILAIMGADLLMKFFKVLGGFVL